MHSELKLKVEMNGMVLVPKLRARSLFSWEIKIYAHGNVSTP
jgi:hypothetical protein